MRGLASKSFNPAPGRGIPGNQNMITVSTKISDRMLVLATAGAARLGLTLDQALSVSDPLYFCKQKEEKVEQEEPQEKPEPATADDTH